MTSPPAADSRMSRRDLFARAGRWTTASLILGVAGLLGLRPGGAAACASTEAATAGECEACGLAGSCAASRVLPARLEARAGRLDELKER